jgi:hypothetical protein
MPSIEIVCIDQDMPTDFSDMSFAVQVSTELESHRSPSLLISHMNLPFYLIIISREE